jgi:hypothetical protein
LGAPQPADFKRFTRALDDCAGQRVFVHCAANKRVWAFVFLYRLGAGAERASAQRDLMRIWELDDVWLEFVNQRLAQIGQALL